MPNSSDLKQYGLKVTAPRMRILRLFEDQSKKHVSAEEIVSHFAKENAPVSIATVYRVLNQFESAGILVKHRFEDDHCVYELDQGDHHDHLVCVKCGAVEEFCDLTIEAHQESIAKKMGFSLTDHAMTLYGICAKCQ